MVTKRVDRYKLLKLIREGCNKTGEMAKRLGVDRITIYRQIKKLKEMGLVEEEKKGRYKLTEEGEMIFLRSKYRPIVNADVHLNFIEFLIELRKKAKDDNAVWIINTDGLRAILFRTFIHIIDIVDEMVEEILKGNVEATLDEKYEREVKQLIQYLALFCIGMDEDGWRELYRIKRDLGIFVEASHISILGIERRQEES